MINKFLPESIQKKLDELYQRKKQIKKFSRIISEKEAEEKSKKIHEELTDFRRKINSENNTEDLEKLKTQKEIELLDIKIHFEQQPESYRSEINLFGQLLFFLAVF